MDCRGRVYSFGALNPLLTEHGLKVCKYLLSIKCTCILYNCRSEMVHGDITTTNIVLDSNDNPRLLDFGVARSLKGEDFAPVQYGDQIGAYTCTTVVADKRMTLKTDYRSFGVGRSTNFSIILEICKQVIQFRL